MARADDRTDILGKRTDRRPERFFAKRMIRKQKLRVVQPVAALHRLYHGTRPTGQACCDLPIVTEFCLMVPLSIDILENLITNPENRRKGIRVHLLMLEKFSSFQGCKHRKFL
jgi:hypothetical protein